MEKPALRKNGYKMVTIRVKHNLTFDDLVRCCISYLDIQDSNELNDTLKSFSKKGFEQHIRECLEYKGFFETVNPELDCFDEVEDEVKNFLLKKYPDWK